MTCQFGIYASAAAAMDDWSALILVERDVPPRDLLRDIAPLLRDFHARQGMDDAERLAAWLTWYLVDGNSFAAEGPPGVSVGRTIRPDVDFFYRISPGLVEAFRVDEVLDWRRIAALEIPREEVVEEALGGRDQAP